MLNALVNTLAYQPHGSEQGYLFWGSWLAHIADSLANTGRTPRARSCAGMFMATCPQLNFFEQQLAARTASRSGRSSTCSNPRDHEHPGDKTMPGTAAQYTCPTR